MILLYKNKDDIQNCNNYRDIKLLSHTMTVWMRVVEMKVRSGNSRELVWIHAGTFNYKTFIQYETGGAVQRKDEGPTYVINQPRKGLR